MRLTYLMLRGTLDADEQAGFADALWSGVAEANDDLPPQTTLLASTAALLPVPAGVDARARVSRKLFDAKILETLSLPESFGSTEVEQRQAFVMSLQHAAQLGLKPTSIQAARMLDEFLALEPTDGGTSVSSKGVGSGLSEWIWERSGLVISELLAASIRDEGRTPERGAALLKAVERNNGWGGLAALCFFFRNVDALAAKLPRLIMRGFIAPNHKGVRSSTEAVLLWAENEERVGAAVPDEVYNRLLSAIEVAPEHGLNALLACARGLLQKGKLNSAYAERLMSCLSDLLTQTSYRDLELSSTRAISISLVRAECIQLASVLLPEVEDDGTLEAWLIQTRSDPLPEVRFALANRPT